MAQKFIIIRGNSGSGKSTIAQRVRDELGEKTLGEDLSEDELVRMISIYTALGTV